MRILSFLPAVAGASMLAAFCVVTPAQALTPLLVANAHASAIGGCPCGTSQNQTLNTSLNTSLFSTATDATAATGSIANASATTGFGFQSVYADAFLAVGDTNPDAQAVGFSRTIEYFDANAFHGATTLTFLVTGSQTSNAGVIGPGSLSYLNWVFYDDTTSTALSSATWIGSDAVPATVVSNFVVPLGHTASLIVDFEADAYAGQRANPYVVYASRTVHTYLDAGAGAPDIVGISGHDYASAAVSGAPEPAIWAMMVLGFGLIGLTMRRRGMRLGARSTDADPSYAD